MAKDSGSSSWAKRDHEPPVDGQHPEGSNATIGLAKEKTAHFFCRSDKESEAVQVARNLVDIVPGRPSAEPGRSSDRVVNGTGSKHPGMEPFPSPAESAPEPTALPFETAIGSDRSDSPADTAYSSNFSGVTAFNLLVQPTDFNSNDGGIAVGRNPRPILSRPITPIDCCDIADRQTVMPPPGFAAAHSTSNGISSDSPDLVSGPSTGNGSANDDTARTAPPSAPPAQPLNYYEHLVSRFGPHTNARMDAPNEGPDGYQFDEMVLILEQQKKNELALYKDTNNQQMLQLDWTAPGGGFNRACMYGAWAHGAKLNNMGRRPRIPACEMIRNFIEIQIKRIDGGDDSTLENCGVHPDYAFLGLIDKEATSDASSNRTSESSVTAMVASSPGAWPAERAATTTTADGESIEPATTTGAGVPSSPGSALPGPGAWPAESSPAESSPAGSSPVTPSVASSDTIPDADPYITAVTLHFDTRAAACERFDRHIAANPTFFALKARAAVYLVRVVGMPGPCDWASRDTNAVNGPRERRATLLGLAGWVALPRSPEKEKREGQNAAGERSRARARMAARGIECDWTFDAPQCVEGEYLPVWTGEGEPGLEDVYAMVWDLVMRRKFVGVVQGYGFGCREEKQGFPLGMLREMNPFTTQQWQSEE